MIFVFTDRQASRRGDAEAGREVFEDDNEGSPVTAFLDARLEVKWGANKKQKKQQNSEILDVVRCGREELVSSRCGSEGSQHKINSE